jgi:3-dehydroquinate dehydratase-2
MLKMMVIHGPNLNLLGIREPQIYGSATLDQIDERIKAAAQELGIEVRIMQSNQEGQLIDAVHEAHGWADALIINPASFTHYSIALRDAIAAVRLPTVEVHLTNLYAREPIRRRSVTGEACLGVISGFGPESYLLALRAAKGAVEASRR